MKTITRVLMLSAAVGMASAARADVEVANDDRHGEGQFSGLDYGVSERFDRAWLVLHFTYRAPCRDQDGDCDFDDPVRARVPGLTYERSTRRVLYQEEGAAPVPCAQVVTHHFIASWDTIDATGQCAYRVVHVDRFVDDGFEGRRDKRKEIRFGAKPEAHARGGAPMGREGTFSAP